MAQSYLMTIDQSDKKKNLEAGAYTTVVLVALALLMFLVSWHLPKPVEPDPPLAMQGIEVNMGTEETGYGTDQPLLPGDPAPEVAKTPSGAPDEAAGDNAADDPDSDVPVAKNEHTKPNAKPTETVKQNTSVPKPVTEPAPQRAKTTMPNGKTSPNSNGTGGNGADSYYKGSNQGIAGGKGDQGAPGGDPNSDSYKGNGRGNGGIRISSGLGGRNLKGSYSFTDEFNRNATVYVDVVVDVNGNVTFAKASTKGTSTTDTNIKAIAERRARELKFTAGKEEQRGILVFNFKVNS